MDNEEVKRPIGAWKKQTTKGVVISFTINGAKFSMWENKYKKEEKHPDYNIVEDTYKPIIQIVKDDDLF